MTFDDNLVREEAIRIRAYYLWEKAGRPFGNGLEFWVQAEREHEEAIWKQWELDMIDMILTPLDDSLHIVDPLLGVN